MIWVMSTIEFIVTWRANLEAEAVVPAIDGRLLTEIVGGTYGGLVPAYFRFGPAAEHYAPKDGSVPVLGCECGEWGCQPLMVSIATDGDSVVWSDVSPGVGPFKFPNADYVGAVRKLEARWAQPE